MEVLISLLIMAFGLLALAGFVVKSTVLSVDASQRAKAAALVQDMASRIANNKPNAATYSSSNDIKGAATEECDGFTGASLDLCEWNNLLAGENSAQSGGDAAQLGFRGCIRRPTPSEAVYVITVAWGGMSPGVPPADLCAKDEFGDDALRRIVRLQVRIPNLTAGTP